MKPLPLLLALSLIGNATAVGYLALRPAGTASGGSSPADAAKARLAARANAAAPADQPVESARATTDVPADTWKRVVSADLGTFAANLRAAGVPDRLVRALINDEINERFKAREEAIRPAEGQRKYWEVQNRGTKLTLEQQLALLDLRREKGALRKSLLGDEPVRPEDADNPIPAGKRDSLRLISEDYETMISQIQREARGAMLPSDEEKIRYLSAERDKELKELLSPAEFAEYQLRSSQTAQQMRWDLAAFAPDEQEFRAIFEVRKQLDAEFPTQGNSDPEAWRKRRDAEKALEEQLKSSLTPERYAEYQRAKDYDYRTLKELTTRLDLPATTAAQVYDLRNSVPASAVRVFEDKNLDYATKLAQLQALAQQTRTQVINQLGQEAAEAYLKRQGQWITQLEQGTVTEFTGQGSRRSRSLQKPRAPKP